MSIWVILDSLKKNWQANKFYSSLTVKKNKGKEYEHVSKVWNKFHMKAMIDYYGSHLKCDILLFVDVLIFQWLRDNSFKKYRLHRIHYLSAPALSWDVILNLTKVKLELADMYLFFKKGMKCGVSYISNRYSKTNKKYLKSYDPKQESKLTIYMVMQFLSFFQQAVSNGITLKNLNWINISSIIPKDMF